MNKLYIKTTIIFIIFLILGLILNFHMYKQHEEELYNSNNKIIANILVKHPELKEEVISIMTTDVDTENVLESMD